MGIESWGPRTVPASPHPGALEEQTGGEVGWGTWCPHLLQEWLDTVQGVLDILVQLRVAGHLCTTPSWLVRPEAPKGKPPNTPLGARGGRPAVPWGSPPKTLTSIMGLKIADYPERGRSSKNLVSTSPLNTALGVSNMGSVTPPGAEKSLNCVYLGTQAFFPEKGSKNLINFQK